MFKRVMLISPTYSGSHYESGRLEAGLGYISEALDRADIENTVLDMGLGYDLLDIAKRIRDYQPDLIGFTMMTFRYKYNYALITEVKSRFPRIPIVLGGPHISTLREQVFRDCPAVDYGVIFEGEETIVELCRSDQSPDNIKGLLFRRPSGEIVYAGDRDFIKNLDVNGFPTYSRYEIKKYLRRINIVSLRGCPYRCIYCPVHSTMGRKIRIRSAKSVADEFEFWYSRGYRRFGIADDNFTFYADRVFALCDELERRKLTGIQISLANGIRADKVNKPMLERMKEVGFDSVAFGVEAGNDRVLKRLKKGESLAVIERAIKDAYELDYRVTLFFLLGSPGETEADVHDSVNLALRYPVHDVRFYNLIPFPNTELFNWVTDNHYFIRPEVDYLNDASHWVNSPVFETPELPAERRRKLYTWANNKVGQHTREVVQKFRHKHLRIKLQNLGLPTWLCNLLASLYLSRLGQKLLVESEWGYRIKSSLDQLLAGLRGLR